MGGQTVRYRGPIFDSARWEPFRRRSDDIIISTPPKCGTTWMQMICALLIFQRADFDRQLDLISPWLDMQTRSLDSVIADLDAQQHRRFIKTHTPLDGIGYDPDITYICVGRDPRDVAISWANHRDNTDLDAFFRAREQAVGLDDLAEFFPDGPPSEVPSDPVERFWLWVDDTTPVVMTGSSLMSTIHHLSTFWDVRTRPNVVMVHYSDLLRDLEGEMRRIATRLGIDVSEDRIHELVAAARFDAMRARADDIAPEVSASLWQNNTNFFRVGGSGQWRVLLDAEGERRYAARVAELAPPDLAEWAHDDPLEIRAP